MRLLTSVAPAALLAFAMMPALAQSTGSERIETVVVTGTKISNMGGLSSFAPVAKQNSLITQEFIATQTAGQTFFQTLNMLPGINFTNNDPYGSSGGNIRMHGQDGNHISVTLDGMPLNDTGNYAMYTNQMLDPEVTERVTINQGTTDVDSPTAAVTGGSIAVRTARPLEEFGARARMSLGEHNFRRYFVKLDSGKFGPFDTRAFFTYNYTGYDKFKGTGKLQKQQFNASIFQDLGNIGWMNLAAHFNRNRNNSYFGPNLTIGYKYSDADWSDAVDGAQNCTPVAPGAGTKQAADNCGSWHKLRINPSDTGNVRFSSLWNLASNLTLTVDANLQYVLANGGGNSTLNEHSAQMTGSYGYADPATNATTTAFGCIGAANGGCDLNGDGDVLDTVRVYRPSTTNTRRWGFNTSLIYEFVEGHTVRAAYTLDYGLHRQTGIMARYDAETGPYSVWAGLDDSAHKIVSADGVDIRYRDRKSLAILNQASMDYQGSFLDGMLQTSVGFRLPFFERELNQYCYQIARSTNPYCTSEVPSAVAPNGTVVFPTTKPGTLYIPPASATVRYNKFLPHVGLTAKPFGDQHQFFAAFTKELAAPKTDNLYASNGTIDSPTTSVDIYVPFDRALPETSTTYTLGYRYLGEAINASLVLWNSQVKNRLISTWDQDAGVATYHSVPGINYAGIDADVSYQVLENLSLYGTASFMNARIQSDIIVNGNTDPAKATAYTGGRLASEVPNWTFTGRVQYDVLPELHVGLSSKYVGRRFATDTNNIRVPDYYKLDLDVGYDLDQLGLNGSSIRFNVDNLTNKHYYGSIGSQSCYDPVQVGCMSQPYVSPSALRTFSVTLTAQY